MVSQTLALRLGCEWIWRAGKEAQGWVRTSARLHSCQSVVGRSLGGEGQRVASPSGVCAAELHAQGCTVVLRYQSLPRLCSCQLPPRNAPGHCWCIDPRLLCFLLCGYCMVLSCSTRRGISLLLTGHVAPQLCPYRQCCWWPLFSCEWCMGAVSGLHGMGTLKNVPCVSL